MIELSSSVTVGDVVARDPRAAAVFARHGIDFCCGGRRSIEVACQAGGLDPNVVIGELAGLSRVEDAPDDIGTWPPDRVIDRIVQQHHAYVRRQLPIIEAYLTKLVSKKSAGHPELPRLLEVFTSMARELVHHMDKEETILFPFIRALVDARTRCAPAPRLPFGTIQNPIRMMEAEHDQAGADLWLLRTLTNSFQAPPEACPTWRACYAELNDFERDLHQHVHLENNVLFPAAARLEEELR